MLEMTILETQIFQKFLPGEHALRLPLKARALDARWSPSPPPP